MLLLATAFIGDQPINNEHYIQDKQPTEIHIQPQYSELTELVKERIKPIEASTLKEIKPVKQVPTPKPKPKPTPRENAVKRASVNKSSAPSGWYPYGQCTYYVWSRRSVGNWNNASQWYWQAQRDGWSTGTTPAVGAIAVETGKNHVAYVESVRGNTIVVSEMNYRGHGVVSSRTVSASSFRYIY